jgi:hypothetical protein
VLILSVYDGRLPALVGSHPALVADRSCLIPICATCQLLVPEVTGVSTPLLLYTFSSAIKHEAICGTRKYQVYVQKDRGTRHMEIGRPEKHRECISIMAAPAGP